MSSSSPSKAALRSAISLFFSALAADEESLGVHAAYWVGFAVAALVAPSKKDCFAALLGTAFFLWRGGGGGEDSAESSSSKDDFNWAAQFDSGAFFVVGAGGGVSTVGLADGAGGCGGGGGGASASAPAVSAGLAVFVCAECRGGVGGELSVSAPSVELAVVVGAGGRGGAGGGDELSSPMAEAICAGVGGACDF